MDINELIEKTNTTSQNNGNTSLAEATTKINQDFKEEDIASIAKASGGKYGYVDIARTPINPDLYLLVEAEEASQARLIPFFRLGMKLRLAVEDPDNALTKSLILKLVEQNFEVQINLASKEGILKALELFHNAQLKTAPSIKTSINIDELEAYQKEIENLAKLTEKIGVSSAKEGLTLIELGAIKTKASDIHFQPEAKEALIRFRIDGILQNVSKIPLEIYDQLAQHIKYEAGMKLNVGYIPQDGRISFTVNERKIDVRVSTIPTEFGETIVMRILDSGKKFASFEELGFSEQHLAVLNEVSDLSQGMILVTGPTGSGKTTSLYSMLSRYNTPERKIITLEDPIEYHLNRIVQSQINEKKGYTFAKGLESILRQDPDVVMIGEIRDIETANTALQAALTGHVLLSTLHTNSALESIPRLINMGLEPFMIAPALDTLMAQRLVRQFCPSCKREKSLDADEKNWLTEKLREVSLVNKESYTVPDSLPEAVGCEACNHTGYLGRIVIAEIFRVDDEFKDLIVQKKSLLELQKFAMSKGMLNMEQDGIVKIIKGITSIAEVKRVTS
jgi:type II secretory ATPase GspE/PulE/Tfp pilus assembly ATPase PilB-like protein